MRRPIVIFICSFALTVLGVTAGLAQEPGVPGAGPIEVGSAIFGGGAIYLPSRVASHPRSTSYVMGGAVTANVESHLGLEGDIGFALSHNQSMAIYGTAPPNQQAPSMLMWSGNLVYSPMGIHHRFIPYLEGGLGALSVYGTQNTTAVGLAPQTTYFTASAGAGVRWYPVPHWGLRGDYRYMHIRNDGSGLSAAAPPPVRSAHRIYAALVLTF